MDCWLHSTPLTRPLHHIPAASDHVRNPIHLTPSNVLASVLALTPTKEPSVCGIASPGLISREQKCLAVEIIEAEIAPVLRSCG
jgi:hypothetical protein